MDPTAIKASVQDLWRRLDEQLHRIEAALPRGTHLHACVAWHAALPVWLARMAGWTP